MTTKRQIKSLVQPLLERNPDLVLVGHQTLWLRPVGSVGRLILIDRTSDPDCCFVSWHVPEYFMVSCRSWKDLGRCGDRLRRSEHMGGEGWYWSDPTMPADFILRVEADILAMFRPLDTTRKCLNFARTRPATIGHLPPYWHLITAIALGELDAARVMWVQTDGFYRPGRILDEPYCRQWQYDRLCLIGEPLLADDRAGLAALLHRWEAEAIVGSPLEPYWVKETLPLERG